MVLHQPTSALVRSCKMDNVTFIDIETLNGTETHAIIDRGNGEFTSMPKSLWDEQQAAKEAQSL
jgi:hypothetical protein